MKNERFKYLVYPVLCIHGGIMKDILDAKIMCEKCDRRMLPVNLFKSGFRMRAVECPSCKEKIVHPSDLESYNHYNSLKGKTYVVKLRVVGNSHAVSIPKEVVDFINEINGSVSNTRKEMNDMVRLCFEDFGKLSLNFLDDFSGKVVAGRDYGEK